MTNIGHLVTWSAMSWSAQNSSKNTEVDVGDATDVSSRVLEAWMELWWFRKSITRHEIERGSRCGLR